MGRTFKVDRNNSTDEDMDLTQGTEVNPDRYLCNDTEKSKDRNVTFLKSLWNKEKHEKATHLTEKKKQVLPESKGKDTLAEKTENGVLKRTETYVRFDQKTRRRKMKPHLELNRIDYFKDSDRKCFPPDLSDDDVYSDEDENIIENDFYRRHGSQSDEEPPGTFLFFRTKNSSYDVGNDDITDVDKKRKIIEYKASPYPGTAGRNQSSDIARTSGPTFMSRDCSEEDDSSLIQGQHGVRNKDDTESIEKTNNPHLVHTLEELDLHQTEGGGNEIDPQTFSTETEISTAFRQEFSSDKDEIFTSHANGTSDHSCQTRSSSSSCQTGSSSSPEDVEFWRKMDGKTRLVDCQGSRYQDWGMLNNGHAWYDSEGQNKNKHSPKCNKHGNGDNNEDNHQPSSNGSRLLDRTYDEGDSLVSRHKTLNDGFDKRVTPHTSQPWGHSNRQPRSHHQGQARQFNSQNCSSYHDHIHDHLHDHPHDHHCHTNHCHAHQPTCKWHYICSHANQQNDEDRKALSHTPYYDNHSDHNFHRDDFEFDQGYRHHHHHNTRQGIGHLNDSVKQIDSIDEARKDIPNRLMLPSTEDPTLAYADDTSVVSESDKNESSAKDEPKTYAKDPQEPNPLCVPGKTFNPPVNGLKFLLCLREPPFYKGCGNCRNCKYNSTVSLMTSLVESIMREIHDVIPDGNCMFRSIVDQLRMQGELHWTSMSLRTQAVNFLRDNPFQEDKTHFSEFLTADGETWYDYLNRMGREGEWGDNIMLRGLADVLGRKICIISTFGEVHNQTTVEPSEKHKSDQSEDVFLGHIDDQHYVSLRKSDWRETWYKNAITVSVQKGEKAKIYDSKDMKNALNSKELPSTVDEYSGVPMAHLTFTVRRLLPERFFTTLTKEYVEQTAKEMSSKGYPVMLYGSAAEGLATSLDYRILSNAVNKAPLKAKQNKVFHAAMILPEDDVVENIDLQSARATFQIEMHYDKCKSGYVRLHSVNMAKRFPDRVKPVGDHMYLSNGSYRGSRGLVTAFKCENWPTFIISDWMDRERPSGWPNGDLMEDILAQFLTIAPFAHPQSSDPDIEWQFCFAKQEFLLAMSLNDNQKYCFHVLQVLLRFHVGDHILKRYFLKNIFFHALENIHIELWNSNPGACVMYLIDRVIDALITRNLPHYFVPGNNLLCVLSEESCNILSTKLQAIRQFPITSIILVAEAYNLNTSWIADRVIEDIPNFKRSHDIFFDVYIPSYITEIQKQIISGAFRDAAKTFMDAFKEISKGSMFSILSLRDFLHEAVHGIPPPIQWWFCFFLDFFHKTKSLCQMFGSTPGVHLCHLLNTPDDAGVFWCIKIPFPLLLELSGSQIQGPPFHLSTQIAFLYVLMIELNKQQLHEHSVFYSRILIQKRKEHISDCSKEESGSSATDTANGSGSHEETAPKKINLMNERMVNILQVCLCEDYIYLFRTYQILGQPEMFTEHVEDLESVCDIISTSSAYKELANIWLVLGFKEKHREAMDKSSNLVSSED